MASRKQHTGSAQGSNSKSSKIELSQSGSVGHTQARKAAGIDIGTEAIFVAVDGEVHRFDSMTGRLREAARLLKGRKVTTVAMEATGVLWLPLLDILQQQELEAVVVNPAHVRMIPGRKSDVSDCQWIAELHDKQLLRASFVPDTTIRELRTYSRLRDRHVELAAEQILHMQQAFELMNVKFHEVISQIQGASGQRVIEAILAGERDPERLLALCDKRIRSAKHEQVIAALEGNYKPEYLFCLRQAYESWQFQQQQIEACDKQIEALLNAWAETLPAPQKPMGPTKPMRHNPLQIDNLHRLLVTITGGADPSQLPGLSPKSVLEILSEVGTDLSIWPTCEAFTAWCGLAPAVDQTGKRKRKHRSRRSRNRVGQIFRECAQSIAASKYLALRGFYFRIKARSGARVAMVATARKLAVLFWNVMVRGMEYVEQGLQAYEEQYRHRSIHALAKRADQLGYRLVAA